LKITKEIYCDVAVVGGGTGGCAAAIAAARRGMHTVLLDRGVTLGGLATNGCVLQIAGCIEGICLEYVQQLDTLGKLRKGNDKDYYRNPSFDPEFGKLVFENMVIGSGCRILYDSTCIDVEMDGTNIK
jgi:NADPH-dependent 2,4-dienoyl-CoA reductase/sulfur reductase-like enzyme